MACIGGILAYVAFNMVKWGEVRQVLRHNRFHVVLMLYTAVVVIIADFLTGVLTAIILYAVLRKFLDTPERQPDTVLPAVEEVATAYGQTAAQYDHPLQNGESAAESPAASKPARNR
jgi:MFS superfamily sulfate permease-like transporter